MSPDPTLAEAARRAPRIEMIAVAGRALRVAVWAAEPVPGRPTRRPLLFFNGIGANIELMSPLALWFPDRDIITFDFPGVGGSPDPKFPYRPWTMALRTSRLLDQLGYVGKVDVMGVSWGGAMAQQFAFQHPARVGKLILAATTAGMLMAPGDPKVLSKMANPRRYMDTDYMLDNFAALYGDGADGKSHVARLRPPTRRGYAYQLAAMAGWTSALFLPFIKARTLVLMGEDDRVVPMINGRLLAALIPHARLETVPGGHLFLISRASIAAPMIEAFLGEPDEEPATQRQAA